MLQELFSRQGPKIERALGDIEANTQNVLRPLINSVAPGDQISSAQFYPLVRYTALQRARTSHAEAQAQEFVQHYVNAKSLEKGLPPGLLIATLENGVRGNILSALSLTPVLYDLGLSVLLADTPVKFVISDNPVVLRNQYWEQNLIFDRLGWSLQGLQIFFPIFSQPPAAALRSHHLQGRFSGAWSGCSDTNHKGCCSLEHASMAECGREHLFCPARNGMSCLRRFATYPDGRTESPKWLSTKENMH